MSEAEPISPTEPPTDTPGVGAEPDLSVPDMSPLAPGQRLGPYVVQALVSQGRSGWVYRARHPITRLPHLLKVLKQRDAAVEARLKAAVLQQARLRHPNAVPFTDTVEEGGIFALVCAAVDGPPLRDLIESGKGMPIDDALPLFAEMLAGVYAGHRLGILHLALTPDCVRLVVLPERVVARVLDFGLATALGTRPAPQSVGVRYVAPEFLDGAGGPGSDIFSLAVIFYEMICGTPPFWGRARAPAAGGLPLDVKPIEKLVPDCPLAVAAALRWALHYEAADRPADAEVFARALFGEDFVLFEEGDLTEIDEFEALPEDTRPVPTTDNGYWEIDVQADPSVRPVKRVERTRPRLARSLEPTQPVDVALPPTPALAVDEPPQPVRAPPRAAPPRGPEPRIATVDALRLARLAFQFIAAPLMLVFGLGFFQAAWAGWQLGMARANVQFASASVDALLADAFDAAEDLVALGAPAAPIQAAVDRGRAAQGLTERIDALVALQDVIQRDLHVLPAAKDPASEIRRRRMARSVETLDDDVAAWNASFTSLAEAQDAPLVGLGEAWGFADGRPFGQPLPFLSGPVQTVASGPE